MLSKFRSFFYTRIAQNAKIALQKIKLILFDIFLDFSYYWYKTATDVSFMFIDEFDAFYHFELAESIVQVLKKMKNTQVILTSHNTNLLTNRIMRPDCYFILTKDKLTSLANATSRELREGHNLEKLYMSGEFNG